MILKWKAFDKELKKWSDAPMDFTIRDLEYLTDYEWCQYLGFSDADKRELYQGDVIELTIMPELMDMKQNSFSNSNLGKYIKEHPEITSIVCVLAYDHPCLTMKYSCYAKYDHVYKRDEDGDPIPLCHGEDSQFPRYLVAKGAVYIGNYLEYPEIVS